MLRNISLVLMCLLLVSCEYTKPKLAYVNAEDVFTKSVAGENAKTFLEDQRNQMQIFLGNLQEKLKADPDNVELQQYIQNIQVILQRRMNAEQQNVANVYNAAFLRVIEAYRQTNKLMHIENIQNVLAYDKALDITQNIIELMNAENITFAAVTDKELLPPMPPSTVEPTDSKPNTQEPTTNK